MKSKTNIFNKFFSKIYVINLDDKTTRWKKVKTQFARRGVKIERFSAIDGRCKSVKECKGKKKKFEAKYNITMEKPDWQDWKLFLPASSLTIGTILILREQVKNKWPHILICEDDIVLGKNLVSKFETGIKEIKKDKLNWDLLYLGCGHFCGTKDISYNKTKRNKFRSTLSDFDGYDEMYVANKEDIRVVCNKERPCPSKTKHLSFPSMPGGTWCYAVSLKGAKKLLKFLDNHIYNMIDLTERKAIMSGKIKALAFDPPIVWHEEGAFRTDSDIPWRWED